MEKGECRRKYLGKEIETLIDLVDAVWDERTGEGVKMWCDVIEEGARARMGTGMCPARNGGDEGLRTIGVGTSSGHRDQVRCASFLKFVSVTCRQCRWVML
jgi:hypothetical protein